MAKATPKKAIGMPSVFAVTGGQGFLRRRFLRNVIKSQIAEGWKVDHADGAVPGELREVLGQGGSIFDDDNDINTLIVVSNPNKADLDILKKHSSEPGQDIVLLLDLEGEPDGRTKFGAFIKSLGKTAHSNHPKPPFYDEVDVAAKFCVEESKLHGKTMGFDIAQAMAKRISTDIGFLSFEIQKMAILADYDKSEAITNEHVKAGMALMSGAIVSPMIEALEARSRPLLFRSLNQIKKGSKGDPTMRIIPLLWVSLSKWLPISELMEQGVAADDGAARLKINPWYYKNKLVPQLQRWPRADVVKLVQVLAGAERAVLNGGVNPWAVLVTGLLGVCGGSR